MTLPKFLTLKPRANHILAPLFWILGFEMISSAIGFLTRPGVEGWFAVAAKPSFMPPNIVFPIVWSLLYMLIALAGWRLWRVHRKDALSATYFGLFCVYMALNWSWSFVFFTHGLVLAGCGIILTMNIISAILIITHLRRDRWVTFLLLPPLCWTSFALVLNASFLPILQQVT